MNTKEMIEFLPSLKSAYFEWKVKHGKKIKLTKIKMNEHIIDEIIKLLKCGEKFEQMFKEIKEYVFEFPYIPVRNIIKDLEQKYFPEPIKKTITIEIEANNEQIITDQFQIFSTQLFRNRQSKKSGQSFGYEIKYKEGD